MSERLVFDVPSLIWPYVYRPHRLPEQNRDLYGGAVSAEWAPPALAEHLGTGQWVTALDGDVYRMFSVEQPAVISDKPLNVIMSCMDAANLPRDRLFHEVPLTLSVHLYRIEASQYGRPRNAASIVAVRVPYDVMARRYDEVCAEFFADPSLPWRGGPIPR